MPEENVPETQLVTFSTPETSEVTFSINGDKDTLWGTRMQIASAFGCTEKNVFMHIQKIYAENELDPEATSKKSLLVQSEGGRAVRRQVDVFNLDVILAVGYRVSTQKATRFRQWATKTLKQFLTAGFVLDESKLANDTAAQRELFKAIRALRHEEKAMYQKVREVFKIASSDYSPQSRQAASFFAMAQDKFHFAITGKTASELILERADATKDNMGLQNFKGQAPTPADAKIGKNYLSEQELEGLENICEQFLLFAESKAFRNQKMSMEEIATKLNTLLAANDYQVLYEYKTYLKDKADTHAQEQYKVYQSRIAPAQEKPAISSGAPSSISNQERPAKTKKIRSGG